MHRRPFSQLVAAFIALGAVGTSAGAQSTVVILVRHGERAPGTGDVPISAAGELRATALAELARAAGAEAVITTQLQRTRLTAAPLASSLGITPEVVATQSDVARHAEDVAAAVRRHAGKVVLVVGHSNTVPAIVAALGGTRYPDLCETEFDALFTVVFGTEGSVRTVRSRYGAPTPAGPGCTGMN